MKIRFEKSDTSIYTFNYSNGGSLLLGDDVKRQDGPLLLDVSITNRCLRGCTFCYKNAQPQGKDISLDDYSLILREAQLCGVTQIAIGGGEPTLHPHFVHILRMTREAGIIPNYSTNGDCLTDEIVDATKIYCGAMAISIYDDINSYKSLVSALSRKEIRINLHFILHKDNLDNYISLLTSPPEWLKQVNAIIFLNYKPTNGRYDITLQNADPAKLSLFFKLVCDIKFCSIGFDTCTSSFIEKYTDIDDSLFDYCEAARRSAYINEFLDVYPCSFYHENGINLRRMPLKQIWGNSELFRIHRKYIEACHGCPLYEINLNKI